MKNRDKDPFAEEEEIIYVSRSEMKRDMLALQELGENIVKLSPGQFATIPITDTTLADAFTTARRIKHREGLRRQMQFIGKVMRKVDIEAMAAAYQELQDGKKLQAQQFHRLEKWRDELISEGPNGVEAVMEKFPAADRQHLRQLVMQAAKEENNKKPPASARKLFRYLRELSDI
ncbi:MAG: ribosome-associated protein [Oceanicoccus sp.]|jgi:ribosome-associated protein